MKRGYCDNIERQTIENEDFRRVLYTGHNLQLVLMTLQPGDEIGEEVHEDIDQFFRIEEGNGIIDIDGVEHRVEDDFAATTAACLCASTQSTVHRSTRTASSRPARRRRTSATAMRNSTGRQASNPRERSACGVDVA
jgi:hypothetical protein